MGLIDILSSLQRLAEINPALILLGITGVYALSIFLRYNAGYVLMGSWTVLVVSLFLFPGGREVLDRAQQLPAAPDKARCLGGAVLAGAPWDQAKQARSVRECRFRGAGVSSSLGSTRQAQSSIREVGAELMDTYGGRSR